MTQQTKPVGSAGYLGNGSPPSAIQSGPAETRASVLGQQRQRGPYERLAKPTIDRTAGLLLSIVTLPVIVVIAIAVWTKLNRPIFFRQERVGRNGKVFKIIKFRTMKPDRRLVWVHMDPEHDRRRTHKSDRDPRLTPLGRFMRKWSLDELPQVWNVLMGHMSLVGPRPELVQIVDRYEAWQHQRHQVKPGVTGLWQITARGNGQLMHENTQIDLTYLEQLSMITDLKILLKTLPAVTRAPEDIDTTSSPPSAGFAGPVGLVRRARRTMYLIAKRLFDLALALTGLVILAPVLLLIAVAIRIESRGPALFRQIRVGYRGQLFRMLKFRTMYSNADETLHKQHYQRLADWNGAGPRPSTPIRLESDPRVTRFGRLLRRWSFDELPNLWNVVTGQMSLVGPRPFVPYEVDLHEQEQLARLEAKPGITGLAQVSGRSDISMHDRAVLDLEYLERRSLWLDLKILFMTAAEVFRRKGD